MSPIFIILLIVAVASARTPVRPEPIRDCGPNAVWSKCTSNCPTTCESIKNPDPIICTADCRRGCACIEGYVKKDRNSVECILPENCGK